MRSDSKKKERMKVRASYLAAVLFTALAVVPIASAHAILVSSTPANDAIVDVLQS